MEQTHLIQIHRLEEHLEAKRQHIMRLESKLDKQQINEALQQTQQQEQQEQQPEPHNLESNNDKDCEMLDTKEKSVAEVVIPEDEDDEEEDEVQEIVKESNCDLTPLTKEKSLSHVEEEEEEDDDEDEVVVRSILL